MQLSFFICRALYFSNVTYRRETDVPNQSSHVRYQAMNRPTSGRTVTPEIGPLTDMSRDLYATATWSSAQSQQVDRRVLASPQAREREHE
jgi:hypothetical protein